ncbi:MerR family transcriptional regulator [Robertmurraya massiliosenegalensis]|uniref:MerR family transcriptional regulator n=1 Tax=Robertmurraya massiliosenegalensis TaxID=1287657 RepID=UPI000314091B|nr:MerR family transcriptional regulator [Robertmurraya massiliosenegalensis]
MLINEVCKKCSLTKKAIEYYEKQGLVHPKIEENGYRNYSVEDVTILQEIAVLRSLGLGIPEIKDILSSNNKSFALSKYQYVMELKKQRIVEQQKALEMLREDAQVEHVRDYIKEHILPSLTIKEKLVQSFPGGYGVYLSIHFGTFLNEKINSDEKKNAYCKIVEYLDNLEVSEEVEKYLEGSLALFKHEDIETMDKTMLDAVEHIEEYMETNKQSIEDYIQFRHSEDYKKTDAYKWQQLLLEFQKQSGYAEIFIANLKILSDSYRHYFNKLEKANEKFKEIFRERGVES